MEAIGANVSHDDRSCELSVVDQQRSVSGAASFPQCEPRRSAVFDDLTRRSW